ncbi:hypothetical protein MF672_051055 (plasmid) [Actinomadura sp. ATCC 31491]|uniref:PspA/IM30 family protein n=1 Tax=Actinomadura luzonensis TaxID=2805427 RepID=A0ABT0GCF6_9ACTN|nr:hypothetical protein [Actinomadura luzonensis]MCK2222093.1 hypothetical protein [Actinomadura luzonensis]
MMKVIGRLASRRRTVGRLAAQLDQARLEAQDARAVAERAEETVRAALAERDAAYENVRRLTVRLAAVDGDRLRGENADLRAEVALLRAARPGPTREEYLRERETSGRLADQLRQTELRLQAAVEELEAGRAAQVSV